ncbi:MAG: hypothetical protein ABF480_05070, partial [Lacticaseibacillus paracasei]
MAGLLPLRLRSLHGGFCDCERVSAATAVASYAFSVTQRYHTLPKAVNIPTQKSGRIFTAFHFLLMV